MLGLLLLLPACHSDEHAAQPAPAPRPEQESPPWSDEQLIKDVRGTWEDDTHEILQFNGRGTLIMESAAEHRSCDYSFPDSGHIRLDCTRYEGGPRTSQTWKFAMTEDRIMISDQSATGTYRRKWE